ncbi:MAG: MarR family transcriptional regulator [Limosilactobacillus sp.]|uniref:MarR family winged helix-turn-helix transcriptional regulator n=1 Tax=Limosilactobacillus sp. TaxID=2773925 RepID=UPI00270DF13B|nr:MarR family transcriptional regulator [Limosilactobacillus sp.]
MNESDRLLNQAIDVYLTGLRGLEAFVSEPSAVYSLSFGQYLILEMITNRPGVGLYDIAKERNVTRSAVTRQMKTLVDKGYVIQDPDPKDRRRQILVVTSKGKEVEQKITESVRKRFASWVKVYGAERGKQLLDLLTEFNQQIIQMKPEDDQKEDNDD